MPPRANPSQDTPRTVKRDIDGDKISGKFEEDGLPGIYRDLYIEFNSGDALLHFFIQRVKAAQN